MKRPRTALDLCLMSASLALLAVALSGCYQDMLKATPFGTHQYDETSGPAADRVALWPLYYDRAPAISFLWPLGEVTDDSWAVRPFVAVYEDGQKKDFLWPLIHLDHERQSGYVFPLAWWRKQGEKGAGYFWTLLVGRGTRGDDAGWFYSPLYYSDYGPDKRRHSLPLLFTTWGHEGEDDHWFGSPLYVHTRDAERRTTFLPLLITGWSRDHETGNSWFGSPLYIGARNGADEHSVVPLALTGWSSSEERSFFISPLYGRVRSSEKTTSYVPPLLSWWTREASGGWSANVALSAFGMTRSEDQSSEHLFPLYWRGRREHRDEGDSLGQDRWLVLFPLFMDIEGHEGDKFQALPLLLSARTETARGNPGWHLLLSLLGWGSASGNDKAPDSRFHHVLPFYYYRRDPTRTQFGIPLLLYGQSADDDGSWRADYLLILGGVWKNESSTGSHLFPIYSHERHSYQHLAHEGARESDEEEVWLEEQAEFDLLLFLYDSVGRRYSDASEYRRHRVLWRLYHDEATQDSRAIDVFPFVAFDRTGDESLTWSWLYRFIRYERRGDAKRFYFLFLPVASWGQDEADPS